MVSATTLQLRGDAIIGKSDRLETVALDLTGVARSSVGLLLGAWFRVAARWS